MMTRAAHHRWRVLSACAPIVAAATPAHARIGLVVGEPFGSFGTMFPVGHAGIYLDHLCAETPTRLHLCSSGEYGVVLARYHDIKSTQLDWLAEPAFTFFYGVDTPAQVPAFVTPALRDQLRMSFRDARLRDVVPGPVATRIERDGALHFKDGEDWQESIGAAFDRRLFVYALATTPQQDAALLDYINALPTRRHYGVRRSNCADFAADILRVVLPQRQRKVLHRTLLADFDFTTPESLARQLDAFGRAHPELDFAVFEVPQLPGSTRRSRPLRSGEMFLTTKRYLFTFLAIQPEFVVADTIAYESKGRWSPATTLTSSRPRTGRRFPSRA